MVTYEELKVKYENPCCHKYFLGIDYIEMHCVISDNRAISVVILPVDVKSPAADQLEYYIVGR
jgi:hypothetical protein